VIFGSMFCVFAAVMLHLFSHLQDIGLNGETAPQVLSMTALFAALGKPVVGWLSDFGARELAYGLALICQGYGADVFQRRRVNLGGDLCGLSVRFRLLGYVAFTNFRHFQHAWEVDLSVLHAGLLRFVEMPWALMASPIAGLIYDQTGSYLIAFQVLAAHDAMFAALAPSLSPLVVVVNACCAKRGTRLDLWRSRRGCRTFRATGFSVTDSVHLGGNLFYRIPREEKKQLANWQRNLAALVEPLLWSRHHSKHALRHKACDVLFSITKLRQYLGAMLAKSRRRALNARGRLDQTVPPDAAGECDRRWDGRIHESNRWPEFAGV